ncbi:alpha/beta hydrolase [Desulfopila sp. IMCC35008]|uniref:alpha/beta hydrolase n=1 Tax=Desulfopila sp. IMCC35008 TaxID=2653858 RepID=UPI0013D08A8E|nr:alpha/beta hydrolase [Desulfopila sp. IMCC35008]
MTDYSKLDTPEVLAHIFHPQSEMRGSLPEGSTDLDIEVTDGVTLGCRFHLSAPDAPTVIFFHGNGECTSDYDQIAQEYTPLGLNLFVTTYRGYGWSTGSPSVAAMMEDSGVVYDFIRKWLSVNGYSDVLFIMGRSLGSAAAIDLVLKNPDDVKGLIIESGFADTLPLAKALGIDTEKNEILEEECFCNCQKIAEIKKPTLILHGARDEMIPVAMAEKLQADSGARNKQFMVIPGATHNTMLEHGGIHYFETIKNFTDTILGKNDWRSRRKKYRKQQVKG